MATLWVWFVSIFFICATLFPFAFIVGKKINKDTTSDIVIGTVVSFGALLVCVGLWILTVCLTTGVAPNYGHGTMRGYLSSVEENGVIWKTYEYTFQVENDKQAVLYSARFSSPKPAVNEYETTICPAANWIGKRIDVKYNQWWKSPYYIGETNYQFMQATEVP